MSAILPLACECRKTMISRFLIWWPTVLAYACCISLYFQQESFGMYFVEMSSSKEPDVVATWLLSYCSYKTTPGRIASFTDKCSWCKQSSWAAKVRIVVCINKGLEWQNEWLGSYTSFHGVCSHYTSSPVGTSADLAPPVARRTFRTFNLTWNSASSHACRPQEKNLHRVPFCQWWKSFRLLLPEGTSGTCKHPTLYRSHSKRNSEGK